MALYYVFCACGNLRGRKLSDMNIFSPEHIFSLESFTSVVSGVSKGKKVD